MNAADIARMKEIAQAAMPGPWKWWRRLRLDDRGITKSVIEPFVARDGHPDCDVSKEDAAHIAAFDPPTVLALIAALEQSQAALAEADAMASNFNRDTELQSLMAINNALRARVTELEGLCDESAAVLSRVKLEIDALRARLEAAKEALKPFADVAATWDGEHDDLDVMLDAYGIGTVEPELPVADFRRARAAIAEMEKGT